MDEVSPSEYINEMTNLGSRTGIGILGCELLFRRKECAIFLNSVVKLDSDLKGKKFEIVSIL